MTDKTQLIDQKNQEINTLRDAINSFRAQIRQLQSEIGALENSVSRNANDVEFEIATLDGALQDKLQWRAEIEHQVGNLGSEELLYNPTAFNKLQSEFATVQSEIESVTTILDNLHQELDLLKKENGSAFVMGDDQEALGKEIVAAIQSFMAENYPHIKAVVSTNLDVSVLTLTEKPTPQLFAEIGHSVNQLIRNQFSDRIETRVIVTVGQVIGGDVTPDVKGNNQERVKNLALERFSALTRSGQIPKTGERLLISIPRDELDTALSSLAQSGLMALKSVEQGAVKTGDIVILCTSDGNHIIKAPFIVEGQSEAILKDVCVTFLKKLDVRQVW